MKELRNVTVDMKEFDVSWSDFWFHGRIENREPDPLVLVGSDGSRQVIAPGLVDGVSLSSDTDYVLEPTDPAQLGRAFDDKAGS